jgi:hypothetical protein
MARRVGRRQAGFLPVPSAAVGVPHNDQAVGGDRDPATRVWRRTADHPLKHCDSCELLIVAYGLDGETAEQARQGCLPHGQLEYPTPPALHDATDLATAITAGTVD